MKKRSNFIVAGLMVFVLAMTLAYPSWAEDLMQPGSTLESKMSELIDSQNKLTVALQKALEPNDQFKIPDSDPQQLGGDGTKFPPTLDCTDEHLEWPSSDTYKETEWAMENHPMPSGASYTSQYADLNGDGLTDQFFLLSSGGGERRSCVRMNNGRGWDLVHKCYAKANNGVWTFWGDCAK